VTPRKPVRRLRDAEMWFESSRVIATTFAISHLKVVKFRWARQDTSRPQLGSSNSTISDEISRTAQPTGNGTTGKCRRPPPAKKGARDCERKEESGSLKQSLCKVEGYQFRSHGNIVGGDWLTRDHEYHVQSGRMGSNCVPQSTGLTNDIRAALFWGVKRVA
jgi:hypothetical protein